MACSRPDEILQSVGKVKRHVEALVFPSRQDDKVEEERDAHGEVLGEGHDDEGRKGWVEAV